MRRPTPPDIAYDWHRRALAAKLLGIEVEITEEVQCGWFQRRLTKGGVYTPCRIWLEAEIDAAGELVSDEIMQCEVNGNRVDPDDAWQWLCHEPITEAEYNFMTARRAHAAWYQPESPFANPRQPVDWLTVATPDFT